MKSALDAFKFLTFAGRFDRARVDPQQLGASIPYFPLVGIVLGLVLVLLNRLLDPRLESEILAALLIAALALLTGAIHYEGLQNTFDALSAKISHGEQTGYEPCLWSSGNRICGPTQGAGHRSNRRNAQSRPLVDTGVRALVAGNFPLWFGVRRRRHCKDTRRRR